MLPAGDAHYRDVVKALTAQRENAMLEAAAIADDIRLKEERINHPNHKDTVAAVGNRIAETLRAAAKLNS
jgi:hypothetical protein